MARVHTCKDLGIIFDSKLTFDQHYKNITTRAYRTLGFISRSLNKFKNIHTYKILYNTNVRSIIDYCTPIWNPYYNIHIKEIERIQQRFTRMIFRKFHFPTESYSNRLIRLNMISLENRRLMCDELILYKIHNKLLRTTLDQDITLNNQTRATRQNTTF